jgi:predicted O-methyltransferase YrrM
MSPRTTALDERLHAYVLSVGIPEHPAQAALRDATDRLPDGGMRSAPEQVRLLAWLIELTGARRVLEIGCFTGYGTLGLALALPPGGQVVTLDVNDGWAAIGRQYWREAGVEGRIDLRLGLALDTLDGMIADGDAAGFDLAYVDADKKSYDLYYERALQLVRPGGILAIDNVLWHGAVADPADTSRQTIAMRALNRKIRGDQRVSSLLLPIGDGLTLARKL